MSTALMSSFYDVGDLFQNLNQLKTQSTTTTDRRIVGSSSLSVTRNRNFSTGSGSAFVPVTGRGSSQGSLAPGPNMLISHTDSMGCGITSVSAPREHKKLDRSMSEPVGSRTQGNINSSRYKTEMCRPFEESGHCKYGDKCQFAHGIHELRNLARHPKYKTELCRTFHTIGFCPYGPRCHFIHNEDERKLNQLVNKNQQANSVLQSTTPTPQQPAPIERPKSIKFNPLGSSFDSPPSSSTGSPTNMSPTFSGDIFSYSAFQSSSSSSSRSSSDSCRSSPVFNSYSPVADILDSTTTPSSHLNVQTPLNINVNVNMNNTTADFNQFNSVLKMNNQRNDNQSNVIDDFDLLHLCTSFRDSVCTTNDVFTAAPPSSPESISGDSVGSSTSSSGSSSYVNSVSSLDVGQALRLPFFNQLSIDSN